MILPSHAFPRLSSPNQYPPFVSLADFPTQHLAVTGACPLSTIGSVDTRQCEVVQALKIPGLICRWRTLANKKAGNDGLYQWRSREQGGQRIMILDYGKAIYVLKESQG